LAREHFSLYYIIFIFATQLVNEQLLMCPGEIQPTKIDGFTPYSLSRLTTRVNVSKSKEFIRTYEYVSIGKFSSIHIYFSLYFSVTYKMHLLEVR